MSNLKVHEPLFLAEIFRQMQSLNRFLLMVSGVGSVQREWWYPFPTRAHEKLWPSSNLKGLSKSETILAAQSKGPVKQWDIVNIQRHNKRIYTLHALETRHALIELWFIFVLFLVDKIVHIQKDQGDLCYNAMQTCLSWEDIFVIRAFSKVQPCQCRHGRSTKRSVTSWQGIHGTTRKLLSFGWSALFDGIFLKEICMDLWRTCAMNLKEEASCHQHHRTPTNYEICRAEVEIELRQSGIIADVPGFFAMSVLKFG